MSDLTTNTRKQTRMTIRQFFEAIAIGALFASPFIIEIIKELLK